MRSGVGALAGLLGRCPAIESMRRDVIQFGASDVRVHVFGETGTGKERVARALHEASPRASRPVRGGERSGMGRRPAAGGAVRPRARGLHRGGRRARGLRGGGRGRDAVSRRGGRALAARPGPAAALPAGVRVPQARGDDPAPGERAGAERHERGPRAARAPGALSRGPVVPPQARAAGAAAAARARGRRAAAGAPLPGAAFGRARRGGPPPHGRGRGRAAFAPVAGKRARARERDAASRGAPSRRQRRARRALGRDRGRAASLRHAAARAAALRVGAGSRGARAPRGTPGAGRGRARHHAPGALVEAAAPRRWRRCYPRRPLRRTRERGAAERRRQGAAFGRGQLAPALGGAAVVRLGPAARPRVARDPGLDGARGRRHTSDRPVHARPGAVVLQAALVAARWTATRRPASAASAAGS